MCDTVPGELILSHHEMDKIAEEIVKDLRVDNIVEESLEDHLGHLHKTTGLQWQLYKLRVDEGDEPWAVNYIHGRYAAKMSRSRAGELSPELNQTRNQLMIVPNALLSLQSTGTHDFTFAQEHSTSYKPMMKIARAALGTRNVSVAILDTGIDSAHSAPLNVSRVENVLDPGVPVIDDNGHGTVVASIIGDVAPFADLCIFKVGDSTGRVTEWEMLAGLCAARDSNVINLSVAFGLAGKVCQSCGRRSHSSRCAVFENVIESVLAEPHEPILVVAAGNQSLSDLAFPARIGSVIAVEALDSQKTLSSFSNYGDRDAKGRPHSNVFLAPGGQEAADGSIAECVGSTVTPAKKWVGTSFAAAYASGAIAIKLSQSPPPSRSAFLSHLRTSADKSVHGFSPAVHGNGILVV